MFEAALEEAEVRLWQGIPASNVGPGQDLSLWRKGLDILHRITTEITDVTAEDLRCRVLLSQESPA